MGLRLINSLAATKDSKQPKVAIESVHINYKNKLVRAKKLTMSSVISMPIDKAWETLKTPALLQFIAKGMMHFKFVGGKTPDFWQEGETYAVKLQIFGFLPFGGTHYLHIEYINKDELVIITKEWDKGAKVWNHSIQMKDLGNGCFLYKDSIVIYGGIITRPIAFFAKKFYEHRQKRWQIVASKNMDFNSPNLQNR